MKSVLNFCRTKFSPILSTVYSLWVVKMLNEKWIICISLRGPITGCHCIRKAWYHFCRRYWRFRIVPECQSLCIAGKSTHNSQAFYSIFCLLIKPFFNEQHEMVLIKVPSRFRKTCPYNNCFLNIFDGKELWKFNFNKYYFYCFSTTYRGTTWTSFQKFRMWY